MARHIFTIQALWDEEAKVFYSESDIDGLHVETESLEEFEEVIMDLAPDLILANHFSHRDNSKISLADMIPAFSLRLPQEIRT
ncbi:MAG: DUF1902 domain-containing protein [Devosiaceae bacterium]|nr:DUF1902 domain-containing protein [Devosiaceae bacterium]